MSHYYFKVGENDSNIEHQIFVIVFAVATILSGRAEIWKERYDHHIGFGWIV